MTRIILAALVALVVSGPAWGASTKFIACADYGGSWDTANKAKAIFKIVERVFGDDEVWYGIVFLMGNVDPRAYDEYRRVFGIFSEYRIVVYSSEKSKNDGFPPLLDVNRQTGIGTMDMFAEKGALPSPVRCRPLPEKPNVF